VRRRRIGRALELLFEVASFLAVAAPLLALAALVVDIVIDASGRLSLGFLTSYPSRRADAAGILPGLVGSACLVVMTSAIALPLGVGTAVYLEEYGRQSRLARLIEVNMANLAGVPSVIYGLLGLAVFVRAAGMGRSLLAGASTLALLVLPVVVMASREALRTVPRVIRESCYALGATRWQTVRRVVLPMALPGIMTGAILAVSRAIGETAPLIVVGAVAYIGFLPDGPTSPFTALPIQIFNWVSRPQQDFVRNAAAGIVVLLVTTLALNAAATLVRSRHQGRVD
jgi:phosphate transport system permease protein